jgi:hypothetical protein
VKFEDDVALVERLARDFVLVLVGLAALALILPALLGCSRGDVTHEAHADLNGDVTGVHQGRFSAEGDSPGDLAVTVLRDSKTGREFLLVRNRFRNDGALVVEIKPKADTP